MSDKPKEQTTEFKDFIDQMKRNYLKKSELTATKSTVLGMEKSFDNQDRSFDETYSDENTKDLKFVGEDSPNIKISAKKSQKQEKI